MLGVTADFPDPLVGLMPVLQGGLHETGEPFPHRRHDLARSTVELDIQGVEDHPPHVVLLLIPGPVADPDWARPAVPGQVVEGPLGQVAFPADAVHDLELERRLRSPPLTASMTKPQYSIASQSKPSRYSERSMNAESLIQVNR